MEKISLLPDQEDQEGLMGVFLREHRWGPDGYTFSDSVEDLGRSEIYVGKKWENVGLLLIVITTCGGRLFRR